MLVCKSIDSTVLVRITEESKLEKGNTYSAREVLEDVLEWPETKHKTKCIEKLLSRANTVHSFTVLNPDDTDKPAVRKVAKFTLHIELKDGEYAYDFIERSITVLAYEDENGHLPATLLDAMTGGYRTLFNEKLTGILTEFAHQKTPDAGAVKELLHIPGGELEITDRVIEREVIETVF